MADRTGDVAAASAVSEDSYNEYYANQDWVQAYPIEFVVRAFLGNYPRLSNDWRTYRGESVLDLGFGDGRNMPLLHHLGMSVFGVEISEEICRHARERMEHMDIPVTLRVGRNNNIPFADGSFDQVLASHACYYVDPGTSFEDNIREIHRVLRPNGRFVFSAPLPSTYILEGANDLGDGHMQITNDPYGQRVGAIFRVFGNQSDIVNAMSPKFDTFSIGSCRNDFWGIEEHVWTVVCHKA